MNLRDGLNLAAEKAKYIGALDLAFRYNLVARHAVRSTIAAFRAADPARRHALRERLTGEIIARARRTPYGRRFGDAFSAWPILTKEQVRDNPCDFALPGRLRIPAATGGTTGLPLRLTRSFRSIAAEQAFLDDLLLPFGLSWARARVAVLRTDVIKDIDDRSPPFGIKTHAGRRLVLSSPHLSAESLDWFLGALAAFRPDVISTVPNMLANLLLLLAQSGRRLHVPLVVSASARLDPSLCAMVERELGAVVIDYYGLAERCALAIRRGTERWFFEPAYGRIELLASPNDEITDGRRQVKIIATGYWTDAQPLIRYDTGDHALVPADSMAEDLEAIAIGDQPFFGIAGRHDEFIFAPDGTRITGLNVIPYEVDNILQLQLVQDTCRHLGIRVIALPSFGPADRARIMANARTKVPSAIDIDIDVVDRLEVTARGKVPYTVRRLDSTAFDKNPPPGASPPPWPVTVADDQP